MSFTVDLRLVRKTLDRMEQATRKRVLHAASVLASNPRPSGAKKLEGHPDLWRIRAGDYRIVYSIEDDRLVVLIIKIGHRGDVYR
ncbi:MAG: type II toxin-antitoxin system RelE/ParE family toxin [Magnetococcales bacterium]|nr:type II toxin-antitoxin system RelE/ParE family toxin [Magnetococcales bacterium]